MEMEAPEDLRGLARNGCGRLRPRTSRLGAKDGCGLLSAGCPAAVSREVAAGDRLRDRHVGKYGLDINDLQESHLLQGFDGSLGIKSFESFLQSYCYSRILHLMPRIGMPILHIFFHLPNSLPI